MTPNDAVNVPEFKAPDEGIAVRMYNTGFGDCFLLAFNDDAGEPCYMLIDCGVHHSYYDRENRMKAVVEDIGRATNNVLSVVAITHEHTDHLYGFKYARDEWSGIEIKDLWLPWTEDPENMIAQDLKERYNKSLALLNSVISRLEKNNNSLADRFKIYPNHDPTLELDANGGNADQLEYLRTRSQNPPQSANDYLDPENKDPKTINGVSKIRFYVLGPPKELKWIRSEKRKSEIYPEFSSFDEETFLNIAISEMDENLPLSDEDPIYKRTRPFEEDFQKTKKEAAQINFFKEKYGFADSKENGPAWRRIEDDWLRSAEVIAIDLDKKTNNVSLVLAVELVDSEKVLLFVGDAQVGNWLSWHDHEWKGDQPDEPVNAEQLLNRTVLYKVGHHGSINATLKKKGLEMMKSDELVAMIPVDGDWAKNVQGWEHPAPNLLKEIVKATKGRVIRIDEIPETGQKPSMPEEAENEQQWNEYTSNLEWDKEKQLWIQYTIK
jgi:hypothetical protein